MGMEEKKLTDQGNSTDLIKNGEYILRLAESSSKQAKAANQLWLVLIVASIVVLYPEKHNDCLKFPFSLGEAKPIDFYLIMSLIISSLFIGFISIVIQILRTRFLLKKIIGEEKFGESEKDLFYGFVISTYNRVTPIAYAINKDYGYDKLDNKKWTIRFYKCLKYISLLVLYLIPIYALYKSVFSTFRYFQDIKGFNIVLFIFEILMAIAVAICFIIYIKRDNTFKNETIEEFKKKALNESR